jgi:fructose-bisphosphate aldolase class I
MSDLASIAEQMVAEGKGILAMDESHGTCKKRFDAQGIECNEETRRAYRSMLVATPGLGKYISGAILFDETLRQQTMDGTPVPVALQAQGILPGIKVDAGAHPLAGFENEKVTEGLDGLRARLQEYVELGATFAKWRAVITIGPDVPTAACVEANAHGLARYAALCQEAGLVPIVEPEVLMEGDHDIDMCYEVSEAALRSVYASLYQQGVVLEGTILKPSMVLSGKDCPEQAPVDEVAEATLACLLNAVPASVPGIVFLSGGQSDHLATQHLNAMNLLDPAAPWPLSFSYGRALQQSAIRIWRPDKPETVEMAQKALFHRAKCNGLATVGQYDEALEAQAG